MRVCWDFFCYRHVHVSLRVIVAFDALDDLLARLKGMMRPTL